MKSAKALAALAFFAPTFASALLGPLHERKVHNGFLSKRTREIECEHSSKAKISDTPVATETLTFDDIKSLVQVPVSSYHGLDFPINFMVSPVAPSRPHSLPNTVIVLPNLGPPRPIEITLSSDKYSAFLIRSFWFLPAQGEFGNGDLILLKYATFRDGQVIAEAEGPIDYRAGSGFVEVRLEGETWDAIVPGDRTFFEVTNASRGQERIRYHLDDVKVEWYGGNTALSTKGQQVQKIASSRHSRKAADKQSRHSLTTEEPYDANLISFDELRSGPVPRLEHRGGYHGLFFSQNFIVTDETPVPPISPPNTALVRAGLTVTSIDVADHSRGFFLLRSLYVLTWPPRGPGQYIIHTKAYISGNVVWTNSQAIYGYPGTLNAVSWFPETGIRPAERLELQIIDRSDGNPVDFFVDDLRVEWYQQGNMASSKRKMTSKALKLQEAARDETQHSLKAASKQEAVKPDVIHMKKVDSKKMHLKKGDDPLPNFQIINFDDIEASDNLYPLSRRSYKNLRFNNHFYAVNFEKLQLPPNTKPISAPNYALTVGIPSGEVDHYTDFPTISSSYEDYTKLEFYLHGLTVAPFPVSDETSKPDAKFTLTVQGRDDENELVQEGKYEGVVGDKPTTLEFYGPWKSRITQATFVVEFEDGSRPNFALDDLVVEWNGEDEYQDGKYVARDSL